MKQMQNSFQRSAGAMRKIVLLPAAALIWNQLTYQGAFILTNGRTHHDLSFSFERNIPLIPWTVSIYFGCFLFWAYHYLRMAVMEAEEKGTETQKTGHGIVGSLCSMAGRFYTADFLIKTISFFFFLLFPTKIDRPVVSAPGFWCDIVRLLYQIDKPYNLFPSIHCSVSWLCWVSVRKDERFSAGYRIFTLVAAIAVCLSTLTTRQHLLADIAGGILTAELCWKLAGLIGNGRLSGDEGPGGNS